MTAPIVARIRMLIRFHMAAGGRVALRANAVVAAVFVFVFGSAPDGLATLRTLGPPTWWLLGLIATFGMFVFEFEVFLPLLARLTFDGGAGTYGSLSVAFGGGAVLGGLVSAAAGRTSPNVLLGVGVAAAGGPAAGNVAVRAG